MRNTMKNENQSGHTAGWVAKGLEGSFQYIDGVFGEFIDVDFTKDENGNNCLGFVARVSVGHATWEARATAKANAQIIAAAPDLLEALEAVMNAPTAHAHEKETSANRRYHALDKARKAIAKARGQS